MARHREKFCETCKCQHDVCPICGRIMHHVPDYLEACSDAHQVELNKRRQRERSA